MIKILILAFNKKKVSQAIINKQLETFSGIEPETCPGSFGFSFQSVQRLCVFTRDVGKMSLFSGVV